MLLRQINRWTVITRSLNIVAILTKNKDQQHIFCQQNYIFSLHMQEAILVFTLKTASCKSKPNR